jgi:2,3-bisphosphoglycerate-independent phosphoglycerate mutase
LKQHGPKKKQKNARETNKHTNKQEKQTAEKLHKLAAKKAEILEKVQV